MDSSMPGMDSSMPDMDSSPGTDAADASDGAVAVTCIGNPLTADGGNLDGGVTLDAAVTTQIVTVPQGIFLDGPQWLDTNGGFLVYSEFDPTSRIQRVAADGGALGTFRDAGFTNAMNGPVGNAVRGGLLITAVDQKVGTTTAGSFFVTAPDGGAAGTLSLDAGSTSPNDLVVGPGNNLYFTDGQYVVGAPGTTGLYQMYPDAAVTKIQQNFGRANGIALSPDNTKLYVGIGPISIAEVDPKAVLVYTVNAATGAVTGPGVSFLAATDLVDVPDGIAVDVGGNLWIAEAAANNVASGRIEIFSPAKKKLGTIPFPGQRPTGVAFGGADGTKLFVTTEASTSGGTNAGVFTFVSRCAGIK
jgi:sugar lactone lactonase YvrE